MLARLSAGRLIFINSLGGGGNTHVMSILMAATSKLVKSRGVLTRVLEDGNGGISQ